MDVLDKTDLALLEKLQQDGRLANTRLAGELVDAFEPLRIAERTGQILPYSSSASRPGNGRLPWSEPQAVSDGESNRFAKKGTESLVKSLSHGPSYDGRTEL